MSPPRIAPFSRLLASLCVVTAMGAAPRLELMPAEIVLNGPRERQQIVVTGIADDEGVRDFTGHATFRVEPVGLASVSKTGLVSPRRDGAGRLVVQTRGLTVCASLAVSGFQETKPVSYRLDVAAVLSKAGCNMGACHGNLNGKGGFKLSLRGDDPTFDLASMTREAQGRRVDLLQPGSSLIVQKPTGKVPHEGGQRFPAVSTEAGALIGWIKGGATDDQGTAPTVVKLDVFPKERIAPFPSLSQQLVVTATFSDGARRDVSRQASYDVSDPTKVVVGSEGRVDAKQPTETAVAVRYLTGRAVSRLAFLAERPNFAWHALPEKNVLDRHVFAKLRAIKVNPSEPATDAVFLRRATLDSIGGLPTPAEVREFIDDSDPSKRETLVDRLVQRPEFADFWALKWADLLRNEEKTMGEKGVWVLQRWLRDQFAADRPLDAFTRDLITAKGSTWTNPAASFFRTNRDPQTLAETVSQVFLGVRLQCARCHNHPFDVWTQDDYYGLAAFFSNVRQKEIANVRGDDLDKHEINGDEIVYLSGAPGMVQPRTGVSLAPKPPQAPAPALGNDLDARDELARWLTTENRQFARNMANRVWFHLLGRGIVEPVDDFRESNPPANPALLDALTDALISNGYRLKPLVALIMKSQTYQLGSEPNETNLDDEVNFSRASVRLLPAEVLLDAISQALGKTAGYANAPRGTRATQLPGARMGGPFLKVFGKPDRLLTCECERSDATTLAQAFQLINGPSVRDKLEAEDNRIGRLLAAKAGNDAILDELTLAALGREPTASERAGFLQHVAKAKNQREAWEDVAWAIVNSKEFLLRH